MLIPSIVIYLSFEYILHLQFLFLVRRILTCHSKKYFVYSQIFKENTMCISLYIDCNKTKSKIKFILNNKLILRSLYLYRGTNNHVRWIFFVQTIKNHVHDFGAFKQLDSWCVSHLSLPQHNPKPPLPKSPI